MRNTTIMFCAAASAACQVWMGNGDDVSEAHASDCTPTVRMPYEQSHTIKLSMLPPGHSLWEYELDHIVPLCLGGTNDRSNLQLQTWNEANRKDQDEVKLCLEVRDGQMTCEQAQWTMQHWK